MLGIKGRQNRPIKRELADISGRRIGGGRGRGMVGLEIDDQNFVFGHHQPVDLAGDECRPVTRDVEPADDCDLGPAALREHGGKPRVGDQRQHALGKRLPLGLVPGGGIAREKLLRGVAPAVGGQIRKRLQQAMHQRAALERTAASL